MMHGLKGWALGLGCLTLGACSAHGELVESDVAGDAVDTVEQEIVGGREATLNALPWMARITWFGQQHCGGVLLHPNWVLTAAHCVSGFYAAPALRVIMGDHNTDVNNGTEQTRTFAASDVFIHPSFALSAGRPYNDVALIRLSSPFAITSAVGTIALPTSTPEVVATVAGWGHTALGASTVLRQASARIWPNSTCNAAPLDRDLLSGELCGGSSTAGACIADSGGPLFRLMSTGNGVRQTVFGTASWGRGTCDTSQVYARVEQFAPWIRSTIGVPLVRNIRMRTGQNTASGRIELRCQTTTFPEVQSGSTSVPGLELSLNCPSGLVQASVQHSTTNRYLDRFYRSVNGTVTELPHTTTWAFDTFQVPSATAIVEYGYLITD